MAEAAEKRQKEQEGRGVKDPDALKRKQRQNEEFERRAESTGPSKEGSLRVSCYKYFRLCVCRRDSADCIDSNC